MLFEIRATKYESRECKETYVNVKCKEKSQCAKKLNFSRLKKWILVQPLLFAINYDFLNKLDKDRKYFKTREKIFQLQ